MKKIISLLLVLSLMMFLVACGLFGQDEEYYPEEEYIEEEYEYEEEYEEEYEIIEEEYEEEPEEEERSVVRRQTPAPPVPNSILVLFLTSSDMRIFEEANAVSEERERYLAFGAFVPTNNRESIRVFALGESGNHAPRLLRDFWSITDEESAREQLERLSIADGQAPIADDIFNALVLRGQTDEVDIMDVLFGNFDTTGLDNVYNAAVARANRMEDEFELFLELAGATEDERDEAFELFVTVQFVDRINRGLDAYRDAKAMLINSFGFTEEELLNLPTLAAWDYGRAGFIARYSYAADYLGEEEAWYHIKLAADNASSVYSSWREFTAAYVLGRALAFGSSSADIIDTLEFLLHHPDSSFQTIDFHITS